jgi:fatty acid-binding protein DegV
MQEKTIDEIETYINDSHKKNAIGVILNETKYLVRGGRMSMLKSMIVSLLKFKLFIYLNENGLSLYGKSYKFSSLLSIVKDMFTETISANDKNVKVIYIFTSDASDIKFNNEKIVSALEKIFPSAQIKYSFLPSVIAAHVGPNYCAISAKVA